MYAVSYHVNPCASMCRILVLLIWCVRGSVYVKCVTKWMYAGGLQEGRKDIKTRRHQVPPFMLSKRWRSSTAFLNLHLTQEPLFPFHSLLCFFFPFLAITHLPFHASSLLYQMQTVDVHCYDKAQPWTWSVLKELASFLAEDIFTLYMELLFFNTSGRI